MTLFDVEKAVQFLSLPLGTSPGEGWPAGAQAREYTRSSAAAQVGKHADRAGLFAFHFEHRHRLELPAAWCGDRSPPHPSWTRGVLPESKYQSFRHDLAVASFHPSHRAKWGTHELCHALVGFAWSPSATPLFHATAARISELLPVALWYFFDEAFLLRCKRHTGGGALHREACADCETLAGFSASAPRGEEWVADGIAFVCRELEAVERTRRLGEPIPSRWGSIDLCSDGLAYAKSHQERLNSDGFAMWVERFAVARGGWVASLDDLIERVVHVCRAITTGDALTPLVADSASGTERWTRQDVGARLLQVWEDCEGECAEQLLLAVDALAHGESLADVVARYETIHESWYVPEPRDVFAVGYPLVQGYGSDLAQLTAGVRSALPLTAQEIGGALKETVARFAEVDVWSRSGIGRRFAAWLQGHADPALADLATYEAHIAHPLPSGVAVARLLGSGPGPHRLVSGVELVQLEHRPDGQPGRLHALVGADDDDVVLVEISDDVAAALERDGVVPEAVVGELSELGLCRPTSWQVG